MHSIYLSPTADLWQSLIVAGVPPPTDSGPPAPFSCLTAAACFHLHFILPVSGFFFLHLHAALCVVLFGGSLYLGKFFLPSPSD